MLKVSRPSLSASRRCKVVLLGREGAGKTAAVQQALRLASPSSGGSGSSGSVPPISTVPTLGADLYLKEETFNGETVPLSIWDCSGADRYRPTLPDLYSSAPHSPADADPDPPRGIILMYDMTDDRSFDDLQYWYNEVMRCCPSAALLVVASKADQGEAAARVTAEDGARQAADWGATHLTISAKTGLNIEGMFTLMIALIKKAQA